ncbi:aminoglycoside adenylyltransferase family protein [Schlegelella sp. S2-27]|uniref:Aminoglycoside (3'') (9) adenylyltransferase n=1 Tax=Caldimonas mangrovi TaxID=2944811 RepID=A0ABT0YLF4_9BURK|nr:aminoglycoside adenylyltransferase family protein [Caldimonas mangrovi]MCM5679567.1 aminoglycoside adenylyltransferase family protein [Caldimonas mangrovi]
MDRTTGPSGIAFQLTRALEELDRHLSKSLVAIHLFGSAVEGGLKPNSDIDILVTVSSRLSDIERKELMMSLLNVSAPSGGSVQDKSLRPLEVTVVAQSDVLPWRYPAIRQLQFGEWLRNDLQSGIFEPPMQDHDLAILLTKVRKHSLALRGPDASTLFNAVPLADLKQALLDTVAQWAAPDAWIGDERNVVLALARIWFSAATNEIASKDAAVDWLLERVPLAHKGLLTDAKAAYLGQAMDDFSSRPVEVEAFIQHASSVVRALCEA